jgi:hypothetical protein
MQNKTTAQIHRFHNRVALHIGSGKTVYLTPIEAKRIARALNAGARDIMKAGFVVSTFTPVRVEIEGD